MSAGLIQLVAYGAQDIFLTNDPQITFFKIVYRRHTNFSTEMIPQYFNSQPDFGKRITAVLSRSGDLIRRIYLVAVLPKIPQFKNEDQEIDGITKFAWVRRIGYALIKSVEIEIGGELIDRQFGDWLNIWHELNRPDEKNIDKIIGDVSELRDLTNGKKIYKLFIPLQFWFCRFAGLALPIVSLQYNHIKINIELSQFNKCYQIAPTHYINIDNDFVNFQNGEYLEQTINGVRSFAKFVNFDIIERRLYISRITDEEFQSVTESDPEKIKTEQQQDQILYARDDDTGILINNRYLIRGLSTGFEAMPRINSSERIHTNRSVRLDNIVLKEAFLLVEYIFLDDEERVRFSQARHEYLIEQVFYNGEKTIDGLHSNFKLGFTQACKELIWISQLTLAQKLRNNAHFNYTDSMIDGKGSNIIKQETLLFNGKDRITFRDSGYFTHIQPYQYHRHAPSPGINVYSFSHHPEGHQPAGSANLSKIDDVRLRATVTSDITFEYTAKLRVYAIVYNVLRVSNGISGLVFSIDHQVN